MNNTTAAADQQVNPLPPVDYLSPDPAFQTTISAYVFVACSGIFLWDILDNLKNDYALLRNYRIRVPTIAYFVSRFSSLGYVLMDTVFQTAQIANCKRFEDWMAWVYTAAISSTSLLFTLRVRAIFEGNKYITVFFGLLWLVVLGGSLTTTQGDTAGSLGSTRYCVNQHFAGWVTSSAIAPLVNDTLVFLAISWRLMQNALVGDGQRFCIRAMLLGHQMPAFSRALLKDGQVYYLTTITTNLVTLILLYIKPVPEVYRIMLAGPNVMLMNIMACRVFRRTRLRTLSDNTMQSIAPMTDIGVNTSTNRREEVSLSPIVFSKFRPRGNLLNGTHSFTIDLNKNEHGVESSIASERLQDSSSLDNIERGLRT